MHPKLVHFAATSLCIICLQDVIGAVNFAREEVEEVRNVDDKAQAKYDTDTEKRSLGSTPSSRFQGSHNYEKAKEGDTNKQPYAWYNKEVEERETNEAIEHSESVVFSHCWSAWGYGICQQEEKQQTAVYDAKHDQVDTGWWGAVDFLFKDSIPYVDGDGIAKQTNHANCHP